MKGRKRTADSLKRAKGTLRRDRQLHLAAELGERPLSPPPWLSPRAEGDFEALAVEMTRIGLNFGIFSMICGLAAQRMLEIRELSESLARDGSCRPLESARSRAMAHLQGLLGECGLSPEACQRLAQTAPSGDNDFGAL